MAVKNCLISWATQANSCELIPLVLNMSKWRKKWKEKKNQTQASVTETVLYLLIHKQVFWGRQVLSLAPWLAKFQNSMWTNIAWKQIAMWSRIVDKHLKIGENTGLLAKQHGKISCDVILGADIQIPLAWIRKFLHHTKWILRRPWSVLHGPFEGNSTNKYFLTNALKSSVYFEWRQMLQLPGSPGCLALQPIPGKECSSGMLCLGTGCEQGPQS